MVLSENIEDIVTRVKNGESFGLVAGNGLSHMKLYKQWYDYDQTDIRHRFELLEILRFESRFFLPPIEYIYLLLWIKHGKLPVIVTTNFDLFFNQSLEYANVKYSQVPSTYPNMKNPKNPDVKLCKLHGDIRYIDFEDDEFPTFLLPDGFSVYPPHVPQLFGYPYPIISKKKLIYFRHSSQEPIGERRGIGWKYHIRESLAERTKCFEREYKVAEEILETVDNILIVGLGGIYNSRVEDILVSLNEFGKNKQVYWVRRMESDDDKDQYKVLTDKYKYTDINYIPVGDHTTFLRRIILEGLNKDPECIPEELCKACSNNRWPFISEYTYPPLCWKPVWQQRDVYHNVKLKCEESESYVKLIEAIKEGK